MTDTDDLRDIVELLILPGLLLRGASNQLGYLWIVGKHPECEPCGEFRLDPPLRMDRIKPWAVYVVHLSSTAMAVVSVAFFVFYPGGDLVFAGITSPLQVVATLWVGLQLAVWACWDPLVLLVRGPAEIVDLDNSGEWLL